MSATTTVHKQPVKVSPRRSARGTRTFKEAMHAAGRAFVSNLWGAGVPLPYGAAYIARERRQ